MQLFSPGAPVKPGGGPEANDFTVWTKLFEPKTNRPKPTAAITTATFTFFCFFIILLGFESTDIGYHGGYISRCQFAFERGHRAFSFGDDSRVSLDVRFPFAAREIAGSDLLSLGGSCTAVCSMAASAALGDSGADSGAGGGGG